jgi:long-chain acyl-CoA synthetase
MVRQSSPQVLDENVLSLFLKKEQELQDRACLRYKSKGKWRSLSWTEVKQKAAQLASSLESLGVKKGDRVALLSNTRYEWTLIDLAILSLGAVTVPIYHSTLARFTHLIIPRPRSSSPKTGISEKS